MYRVLSNSFRLNVYLHLVHRINKHVELLLDKKWFDVGILNDVIAERLITNLSWQQVNCNSLLKLKLLPILLIVLLYQIEWNDWYIRDILVRASRSWYFVLKTQLLIACISKSNKALDYVPEIFINQPFLGKRFIILDIKSITPRSITSDRYTCRSCNRQITRENINLNSLTKTTICTNLLSISSSRGMEIEPFVQTL